MNQAQAPLLEQVPLFPVHAVLFPGGELPLRIFEPRYVEMVSDCIKGDREFGVVLISEGEETGQAASCHAVGTLARIIDWQSEKDGLLGIACIGGKRFNVLSSQVAENQLITARIEIRQPYPSLPVPGEHAYLLAMLEHMLSLFWKPGIEVQDDAAWVACRMAELLPIEMKRKQQLLELDDPVAQLAVVAAAAAELSRSPESSAH